MSDFHQLSLEEKVRIESLSATQKAMLRFVGQKPCGMVAVIIGKEIA